MIAHGINLNAPSVREFCVRWRISKLSVFGSILRDDFRPDSDIDFLAEFEPDVEWDAIDHLDMEEELGELLGRRVEIIGSSAVEYSLNSVFKKSILSTAEMVCAK